MLVTITRAITREHALSPIPSAARDACFRQIRLCASHESGAQVHALPTPAQASLHVLLIDTGTRSTSQTSVSRNARAVSFPLPMTSRLLIYSPAQRRSAIPNSLHTRWFSKTKAGYFAITRLDCGQFHRHGCFTRLCSPHLLPLVALRELRRPILVLTGSCFASESHARCVMIGQRCGSLHCQST